MVRSMTRGWILFLTVLLAGNAVAAAWETTGRIANTAIAALDVGQGGEATVDPALRLVRCNEPLTARVVSSGTVEVGCSGHGWKVFVPVQLNRNQQVVVLRRAVAPGQVIVSDDLETVQRDLRKHVGGVFVDPAQAVGRRARRPLQPGTLLAVADLHAEVRVRRGETVDLVARRGSVEIRVAATATKDAAIGDTLSVVNQSNKRTVTGVVDEDGSVKVK